MDTSYPATPLTALAGIIDAPVTEHAAIAALDHIAVLIAQVCGPLRVWDTTEPFDEVLRSLQRRLTAAERTGVSS